MDNKAPIFLETNSLKNVNCKVLKNEGENLKEVAHQFEALFIQMMLKSMREANASFESDFFSNDSRDMYQDLYDQQLSLSLASGKGIGIAESLIKQLTPTEKPTSKR